jgi:hypothetical protein
MVNLLMLLSLFGQLTRDIPWERIKKNGFLLQGKIQKSKKYSNVLTAKSDGEIITIPLFFIKPPSITSTFYQMEGEIRYEGVLGRGYLEMISHFKGGRKYFTRTLGGSGPLKVIEGSSKWRNFSLPFSLANNGPFPTQLTVNMVFYGKGQVWISPMKLVDGHRVPSSVIKRRDINKKRWWNEKTGSWIGAIWGSFIGLFGALAAFLTMKNRGKLYVLGFSIILTLIGVVGSIVGLVAWLKSQPHEVYFPIALAGGLSLIFGIGFFISTMQKYKEYEIKKMKSKDL